MARDQQADRVPARRRHRPPGPPAVRRPAGRSRRSSRSCPTGSPRPPRGLAGPRPAGRPGRMRRRAGSAGPASRRLERGDRRHRGAPGADRRAGTSRAFVDLDAEPLRQVGVERRLGRQPGDGDDAAFRGGEVERSPRAGDRRADGGSFGHTASLAQSGRCYTPREYERATDQRADPADRGHDLRVVRQPDRALPAARRRASRRRPSTWPPRPRRSATGPTSPIGRRSSAPSRRPATTSARGRRSTDPTSPRRSPTSWPTMTANARERPVACSSGRWSRSRSPPGSWSSCSRRRRRSR